MDGEHRESGLFFSSLVQQQAKPDQLTAGNARRAKPGDRETDWHKRQEKRAYELPPLTDAERVFRHGGWWQQRERVYQALTCASVPLTRRERFALCGCDCVIEYSPTLQQHRVRASYCGDRFCVPCARSRSIKVQANLLAWTKDQRARLVTLTLKPHADELQKCLDFLLQSFTRLRETRIWSDNVTAGAYAVEITRGERGMHWHVHLHAIVIGSYIDQRRLSEAWCNATDGSPVVDVREVKDHARGVYYVAKYVGKGVSASVLQDSDAAIECVLALRGRRLLGTFGEWRNRKLENRADEATDWRPVGRFTSVHAAALRSEPWAVAVFRSLGVSCGLFSETPIFVGPVDDS